MTNQQDTIRIMVTGAAPLRRGSTLTEVLVAMMIASIGLVSVATLFPLAALRAIKGAQFTSATDSRFNAEAIIDLHPNIVSNPVYVPFPSPPLSNNAQVQAALFWDLPLVSPQNYIVDPLGFAMVQNLNVTMSVPFPNAPAFRTRPEHFFGNDVSTGLAIPWQPLPRYALSWRTGPVFNGGNIPVPIVDGQPFVDITQNPSPPRSVTAQSFQGSVAAADYAVTMPDSWIMQLSATGLAATAISDPGVPANTIGITQIDVPGVAALVQKGGLSVGGANPTVRVVIFSSDGLSSHARNVTFFPGSSAPPFPPQTTANTVMWTEDINSNGQLDNGEDLNNNGNLDQRALPLGFIPGIVRIEQQDRRYTWLLTVRQSAVGLANIDVVVFFNRPFDSIGDDELLYQTPAPLVNAGQTTWGFTAGNNQVTVAYTVGGAKPFMRRGGFVFDANNALWYRITNVSDPGTGTATIALDVPAIANGPAAGGRAMFPRGIVDVFPIGSKSF